MPNFVIEDKIEGTMIYRYLAKAKDAEEARQPFIDGLYERDLEPSFDPGDNARLFIDVIPAWFMKDKLKSFIECGTCGHIIEITNLLRLKIDDIDINPLRVADIHIRCCKKPNYYFYEPSDEEPNGSN